MPSFKQVGATTTFRASLPLAPEFANTAAIRWLYQGFSLASLRLCHSVEIELVNRLHMIKATFPLREFVASE